MLSKLLSEYALNMIKTNAIMPANTSVKEKKYVCPTCDYRCSSNADRKTHMHTHTIPVIYICDVDLCIFECESKEDLQAHKTGHLPPNDMNYVDAIKRSEINQQEQNQYDWVGPCKHMKIHTGEKPFQCTNDNVIKHVQNKVILKHI